MFLEEEMAALATQFIEKFPEEELMEDGWFIKVVEAFGIEAICDRPNDLNLIKTIGDFDVPILTFSHDTWATLSDVSAISEMFPDDKAKFFLLVIMLHFIEKYVMLFTLEGSYELLDEVLCAFGVVLEVDRISDMNETKHIAIGDTIFDDFMKEVSKYT